jgi:hypothetical protein
MSLEGDINAAYEDVRNDKTDTNWILLSYADDKSDQIGIAAKGMRYFKDNSKGVGD